MSTFLPDPVMLARMQFGANITFHILFPSITISLAWLLLFFKLRFNKTGESFWMEAYGFWVKIFALTFALGVVSGITMSFQFGTNWPGFMQTVGNIAGPLLAYEVLTAFFLEATFLGIMLFGAQRVSNRVHTAATVLVALGTSLSAFWILALNSWMHTPVGFEMINGQAHATDWLAIIFNPSFPYRFAHMMVASGITGAFLVSGISAYRWLRGDKSQAVQYSLRVGVTIAAILLPLQILLGDAHGLNTLEHQPAKVAAMEGLWETKTQVPLLLFAIPDQKNKTNHYELAIPGLASLILTHDIDGEVKGINAFGDKAPPVAPVFWAFRIMVGVGLLMLAVSWVAAWQMWFSGAARAAKSQVSKAQASKLVLSPWLARVLVLMSFSGWVATIAGWYVTEIGRQPYLVHGVLSTLDAAAPIPPIMLLSTLIGYVALYLALIAAYVSVVFYLARRGSTLEKTPEAESPASSRAILGA